MNIKGLRGFTLIELMIAVAIFGILVTIAYPSYVNYILQSRRSDALVSLSQAQMMLERCYSQNFSYTAACGLPSFPLTSAQKYYSITLQSSNNTYLLTATPLGSQTRDTTCAKFTVDQTNQKIGLDSSGSQQTICWNPT